MFNRVEAVDMTCPRRRLFPASPRYRARCSPGARPGLALASGYSPEKRASVSRPQRARSSGAGTRERPLSENAVLHIRPPGMYAPCACALSPPPGASPGFLRMSLAMRCTPRRTTRPTAMSMGLATGLGQSVCARTGSIRSGSKRYIVAAGASRMDERGSRTARGPRSRRFRPPRR